MSSTSPSTSDLHYIYHHVFLPPKLPEEDDSSMDNDIHLLQCVVDAVISFQDNLDGVDRDVCDVVIGMLRGQLDLMEEDDSTFGQKLIEQLNGLKPRDCLALHVGAQNAGVVIHRKESETIFHLFDVSPTSEAVTTTQGRLLQCFPDASIAISNDRFNEDGDFVDAISDFLASLCQDTPDEVKPKSIKIGREFVETRDVADSRLITELFKDMLLSLGQFTGFQRFYKHTRDEIIWKDAFYPWRRSSLWLFIRVAVRISLSEATVNGGGETWYKQIMLFIMSHFATSALQDNFDSDSLFTMTAKLRRRLLKLEHEDGSCIPPWLQTVKTEIHNIDDEIVQRWKLIETGCTGENSVYRSSSLSNRMYDTQLRVDKLQDYLSQTRHDLQTTDDMGTVARIYTWRLSNSSKSLPDSVKLRGIKSNDNKRLFLYDIERWVRECLDKWLETRLNSAGVYFELARVIEDYSLTAMTVYSGHPEEMSTLFLTTVELWIAFDRVTTFQLPLLRDFHPELKQGLLDPLLLKTRSEMERLHRAEEYIRNRQASANQTSPSVLTSFAEANSIAVRYYEGSPEHQALMQRIEKETENEKTKKVAEYEQKMRQYDRLRLEINSRSCDTKKGIDRRGLPYETHLSGCKKCSLQKEAQNIKINRIEEPLPKNQRERQAVVFELTVPPLVQKWRDITFSLLNDVFSTPSQGNYVGQMRSLLSYQALKKYVNGTKRRLTLASSVKPFAVTHYRAPVHIKNVASSDLVVPNCMRYQMHDSSDENWIESIALSRNDVRGKCTFRLPQGLLHDLQFAVNGTAHTSNEIISFQEGATTELNLHEHYSFGTLGSGHRLQWLNILREFTSGNLDFSRLEVNLMVMQAAWQAGPASSMSTCGRDTHFILENPYFATCMINILDTTLSRIEGNWQNAFALLTCVTLANKVLSHCRSDPHCEEVQTVLKRSRYISLKWADEIKAMDSSEMTEQFKKTMRMRLLEIVLICHLTYDVDPDSLAVLASDEENIAIILECLITINENQDSVESTNSVLLRLLSDSSTRLSHALEPVLRDKILENPVGVDRALEKLWSGYRRGTTTWCAGASGHERYLCANSASQNHALVQLDLLTGHLLVNGSPLSRLPDKYEKHPNYARIFGNTIINVFPSSMDRMAFQSRQKHFGFDIHFAMTEKGALVVRAVDESGIYELLPPDVFEDIFPTVLVRDYAHWLDLNQSFVQWRPIKSAWEQLSTEWWLDVRSFNDVSLSNKTLKLVNPRSATAQFIYQYSDAIETHKHVQIGLNQSSGALEIRLPRLVLDFHVESNSEKLISRQFRGMFLDKDYCLETLTGLRTRIVLRREDEHSRMIVIPRGAVEIRKDMNHVSIKIKYPKNAAHVSYHAYELDDILHRFVDDDSLESKLYRCYLHAVTSHCLPDSFTKKTGTEEALDIIISSPVKSFQDLNINEIELLELIESCSPRRQYYPQHLKVMQEVHWSLLPPLSQHPEFARHVQSIENYAQSLDFLRKNAMDLPNFTRHEPIELLRKAEIRDSQLRSSGYGAENHTTELDAVYTRVKDTGAAQRSYNVYDIARLTDSWSPRLTVTPDLLGKLKSRMEPIEPAEDSPIQSLGYDRDWLSFDGPVIAQNFCQLTRLMSEADRIRDRYKVLVTLSTMAYSQETDIELIETLLAFATVPEIRNMPLDCSRPLELYEGCSVVRDDIETIIKERFRPFESSPDVHLMKRQGETKDDLYARRHASFQQQKARIAEEFLESVMSQWASSGRLRNSASHHRKYINVGSAFAACEDQFRSWERNATFRDQAFEVQEYLNRILPGEDHYAEQDPSPPVYTCPSRRRYITWKEAFSMPPPNCDLYDYKQTLKSHLIESSDDSVRHIQVESLIMDLFRQGAHSRYERSYLQALETSLQILETQRERQIAMSMQLLRNNIAQIRSTQENEVRQLYRLMCSSLSAEPEGVLSTAYWLRLSNSSWLRLLASNSNVEVPQAWKTCLIKYGLALSELQHARRVSKCLDDTSDILLELRDFDHAHWSPERYPDWLLFELENNIMIRKVQVDIANEMISPSNPGNSVMQLHMGEGKSSVIVPIAASVLADGQMLPRIIVLKPLFRQMQVLLVRKLGGLLGRRVFNMPISRSNQFDDFNALKVREICQDCIRVGGVLLLQPEHILSFRLMAIERSLESSLVGKILHSTNRWLSKVSRDILDESDELLNVRGELIYAIGDQQSVDLGPERWYLIQELLGLVQRCAPLAVHQHPDEFQIEYGSPGSFSRIRILTDTAADTLINFIVDTILSEGFLCLPKHLLDRIGLMRLENLLKDPNTNSEMQGLIMNLCNNKNVWKRLLFLRGLLAQGIVKFALQKLRWRVNYGTDSSRTKLAVPYKAKDVPSSRSEFSHPDVAIILTCLSYYYNHLTDEELYLSFEDLLKLDDAHNIYLRWIEGLLDIPKAHSTLAGVNMRDPSLPKTVFPFLRKSKAVVDFYLSTTVFPHEMKEFPSKLSSSGWDLAELKTYPITGFSGTNDSGVLLPSSIAQNDLIQLAGTNAGMLQRLLRPENVFLAISTGTAQMISTTMLLEAVASSQFTPPIRVILDVGAQVLEMSNLEFSQAWLRNASSDTHAVVFFNAQNELCVLDRAGMIESFATSPFARRMDECLVYLDESHTRGTDLKLPSNYRAAVTLGPFLTKDKLAQACMRMRKLGRGQSVVFFASGEITEKILTVCGKTHASDIEVKDVLFWSIRETMSEMKRCIPLWMNQRARHSRQQLITQSVDDEKMPPNKAKQLLEPEAQLIEQRYGLSSHSDVEKARSTAVDSKLAEFGLSGTESAIFDEEQEREVAPEIQQEREVQRPRGRSPLDHSVHKDLRTLVRTGEFRKDSTAFKRAFHALRKTSANGIYPTEIDEEDLWVTTDFCRTILLTNVAPLADDYLRPVNWILRCNAQSQQPDSCVIITPFEAHELLHDILNSKFVDLPIYAPRTTAIAPPLEHLTYCNIKGPLQPISTRISHLLSLFAGQLYLANYEQYISFCRMIGVFNPSSEGCTEVAIDGFIDPETRAAFDSTWANECNFVKSPLNFLGKVLTMRRKGLDFRRSHIGRILAGEKLRREDFSTD